MGESIGIRIEGAVLGDRALARELARLIEPELGRYGASVVGLPVRRLTIRYRFWRLIGRVLRVA